MEYRKYQRVRYHHHAGKTNREIQKLTGYAKELIRKSLAVKAFHCACGNVSMVYATSIKKMCSLCARKHYKQSSCYGCLKGFESEKNRFGQGFPETLYFHFDCLDNAKIDDMGRVLPA